MLNFLEGCMETLQYLLYLVVLFALTLTVQALYFSHLLDPMTHLKICKSRHIFFSSFSHCCSDWVYIMLHLGNLVSYLVSFLIVSPLCHQNNRTEALLCQGTYLPRTSISFLVTYWGKNAKTLASHVSQNQSFSGQCSSIACPSNISGVVTIRPLFPLKQLLCLSLCCISAHTISFTQDASPLFLHLLPSYPPPRLPEYATILREPSSLTLQGAGSSCLCFETSVV